MFLKYLLLCFYSSIIVNKNNRGAFAYPYGAGHCDAGTASTRRGHGGSARSLSEANIGVFWGGTEMNPSEPTTMGVDKTHTLTVIRKDASKFIGFLVRLSGQNGENVASALVGTESFSQVSNLCATNVKALTHVSATSKDRVTMNLSYPAETNLLLEVTVVTNMASNWFYESFNINVSGNATAPTSTPPDFSGNTGGTSSTADQRLSSLLTLLVLCVATFGIFLAA